MYFTLAVSAATRQACDALAEAAERTDPRVMPIPGPARVTWRELTGVPTVERFHTAAAILYHAWMRRTFPVRLLDPANGRELASRDFPATGPRAAVLLGEKHAAVAIEGALLGLRP